MDLAYFVKTYFPAGFQSAVCRTT